MAPKPKDIPKKAEERWAVGDVDGAIKLSGLKQRQLYTRLGAPGRQAAPPPPAVTSSSGQRLVKVAPAAKVPPAPAPAPSPSPPPPPSEPDPTVAEIEALDTLTEARAVLREVRAKMSSADEVRYASLAEKALAAINRIEQIEARRPRVPPRDEVQDAIRGAMGEATEFLLRQTREAAAKLEADRRAFAAWCRETLAPSHAAEVVERVSAIVEGRTCARCSKPRKGELPVCAEHEQAETVQERRSP